VEALGGWATDPVKKTINALVSLRKGSVIPALAEIFALFVSEYKKSLRVEVTLAAAVNDTTISDLQKKLSSALGGEVKMNVKTDPSLIGGLTVRLGDSLLDRSVAGTLQRVASQLAR
jgi:F-type H+-transporting ATPase subunit delta